MKSVGEAMALGGNFQESLGKAMRSIDKRHMGFNWDGDKPSAEPRWPNCLRPSHVPTEHRYLQLMRAIWGGAPPTSCSPPPRSTRGSSSSSLINQTAHDRARRRNTHPEAAEEGQARRSVRRADRTPARFGRRRREHHPRTALDLRSAPGLQDRRHLRRRIRRRHAVYYSCYADETELRPREREAVIILGSGPNRIGQGIEFDYTCVHAVQELGKDYDTIMVNCNPRPCPPITTSPTVCTSSRSPSKTCSRSTRPRRRWARSRASSSSSAARPRCRLPHV